MLSFGDYFPLLCRLYSSGLQEALALFILDEFPGGIYDGNRWWLYPYMKD